MNRSEVYGLWGDNSVTEEKKAGGDWGETLEMARTA